MKLNDAIKLTLATPLLIPLFYLLIIYGCIFPIVLVAFLIVGAVTGFLKRRKKYGTSKKKEW